MAATSTTRPSLGAASATVAFFTALSRVSGLARVVVIAAVLGATHFGNLFQAVNLLPNILFEFMTGPLIASLLVPAVVAHVDRGDRAATERVAGGFLGLTLVAFALAGLLVVVPGPLVLRVLSAGAGAEVGRQAAPLGWVLLALVVPQVLLYAVVGTCVALQNAHDRFGLAAAAPLVENMGLIVTLGVYAAVFGTRTALPDAGYGHVLLLGLGATAAVALHAAVQLWGVHRVGLRLRPRAGWRDPEVKAVARLALPSSGYAALNAARQFIALVVGSSVAGGVVAFQLAMNFYNLPVALGGRPVAQVTLPRLARAQTDDVEGATSRRSRSLRRRRIGPRFAEVLGNGMSLSLFLVVPAGLCMALFAPDIAQLVSYGAMRDTGGIDLLAAALMGLGLGVIGESMFILGTQASYARRDARTPFRVSVLRAAVTVTLMLVVLNQSVPGPRLLLLLGAAVAAGDLIAAGAMWMLLRRFSAAGFGARRDVLATLAASGSLVGAAVVSITLFDRGTSPIEAFWRLAFGAVLALGAYIVVQHAAGSSQGRALVSTLARRRERV